MWGGGGEAIDHGQTFAYVFHSVIIMMMQSSNPAISAFDSSLRAKTIDQLEEEFDFERRVNEIENEIADVTTPKNNLRDAVLVIVFLLSVCHTDSYIRSDKLLIGLNSSMQAVFYTALSVIMTSHATFRCEKTCSQFIRQASVHNKTIVRIICSGIRNSSAC